MTSLHRLRLTVLACTTGLILLCLAWELVLAPQRPGGSLLALKALPLIAVEVVMLAIVFVGYRTLP